MTTLVAFVLVIALLVVVHELGHFMVAKLSGVWVKEFAFGFGKRLFSVQKGDTRYAVNLLPLGGYVMMAGMEPGAEPDPRNFDQKSIPKRLAIIAAGPVMNFLLAVLLLAATFAFWGIPRSLGTFVGQVVPGYPAAKAGIRSGDRIVSVGGHAIHSWADISRAEAGEAGKPLEVIVHRGSKNLTFTLSPVLTSGSANPIMGVSNAVAYTRLNPIVSLEKGFSGAWGIVTLTIGSLWSAVVHGRAPPVVGIVGIADLAGQSLTSGWLQYLNFASILSVSLAIFNLLPLPPLDGARLAFLCLEAIRRRPVSQKLETLVHTVGFYLLIAVAVVMAYHDLTRHATGL